MDIATVVRQLRSERDRAANEVQRLDAAIAALNGNSYGKRTGRAAGVNSGRRQRKLSPEALERIRQAQAARWKKWRKAHAR